MFQLVFNSSLELGKLLVSEISGEGNEDTLTVWLMHYIAELIKKAEKEKDSSLGARRRRKRVRRF
jgi:hypothetical protein